MKSLTIACLLILSFYNLSAEEYTVEGKLVDEEKNSLISARVSLHEQSDSSLVQGKMTDKEGRFKITAEEGNYILKMTYIGYENKYVSNLDLTLDLDLGTITLAQSSVLADEILVEDDKKMMEMKLDKRVFNIEKDPTTRGMHGADVLDNLPSVNVDPEGNISLRGSNNVRILVDGKQSGLVTSDPESLRQLMGDMIERIEVITNPSARYDAQGEVGIINIVLKKNQESGYHGSFEGTSGIPDNYGLTVNSNYRTEDYNIFGSFGSSWRRAPGYADSYQRFFGANSPAETSTYRDQTRGGLGANIRLGTDIYFDKDNILTFSTMYRHGQRLNNAEVTYTDYNGQGEAYQIVTRTDDEAEEKNDIEFNLSYELKFEGKDHKLTFDSKFEQDKDLEESDFLQENQQGFEDELVQKSSNLEFERNQLYQLDYVYPFSEDGKFEAGAKSTIRKIDNDYWVKEEVNGQFQFLDGFNNNFLYFENIYAAYIMGGNKWGDFGAQFGLRAEYSDITTELVRTSEINNRNYLDLFPTIHFSYDLTEVQSLQLSYARRINRPYFRSLMPFSNYTDPRNFYGGNPDLNPEYTDSYETGYLLNWEDGSLLSSLYYRNSTGLIQRVTSIDSTGVTNIKPNNIGTEDAYGAEFNFSYNFTDWWEANTNFNFYRSKIEGNNTVDDLNSDTWTWDSKVTSNMDIFFDTKFQLTFNYRAPKDIPQGMIKEIWYLDFGLSKDFWDNSATLTLSGRDVFDTRMRRMVINGENFYFDQDFNWRSGQVTLTFSYRINQKKEKEAIPEGDDF